MLLLNKFAKNYFQTKILKYNYKIQIITLSKKHFNFFFERPTQNLLTHLHILGMIVKFNLNKIFF